jgi:hypothetical protein
VTVAHHLAMAAFQASSCFAREIHSWSLASWGRPRLTFATASVWEIWWANCSLPAFLLGLSHHNAMTLFSDIMICCLFNSVASAGDLLREGRVPQDFSKLLEKCRNCDKSENHRDAFRCFATRILPAVNAGLTKFGRRKHKEILSECFSCTDGAFRILPVVNYGNRWRSQHTGDVLTPSPGGTGKEGSRLWEDARHTSATEGARRGVSWPREGLVKFNKLSAMVKLQPEDHIVVAGAENMVETDLMAWCQAEAGLLQLADSAGDEDSQVVPGEADASEPRPRLVESFLDS